MKGLFSIPLFAFLLIGCCFTGYFAQAQSSPAFKPTVNRILFILDGSGSMRQAWEGKTKFDVAKALLAKVVDSIERKNPNVEFGIRVFGFQYPHSQKNCSDSKLLVPFAKNNASSILSRLQNIHPQGMSPIAYSIQQGAKDFPNDPQSLNSIVLITDGEENCGGDPCSASQELAKKRISLKPFIVGLHVDSADRQKYNCIGTFYNAESEAALYQTVGVIIKQTLNSTTTQINLLDLQHEPTVTNIPFTVYDHYSGNPIYNFIHTLDKKGNPDTLFLDPTGVYDIELHTFPPIWKKNIELIPGIHNIIALDVPLARLSVAATGVASGSRSAQVLVRPLSKAGKQPLSEASILNTQELNAQSAYLANRYRLEILTTPTITIDTALAAFGDNRPQIKTYGTLTLMASENLQASIFTNTEKTWQLVLRLPIGTKAENYNLQPGSYRLVYKPKNSHHSDATQTQSFTIDEGRTTVINLQP